MNYELCFDKNTKKFCPVPVKVLSSEDSDSTSIDKYNKSSIRSSPRHIQHVAIKLHNPRQHYFIINGETKLNHYRELESHSLKCEGYKVIDLDSEKFKNMSQRGKAVSYLSELIIK